MHYYTLLSKPMISTLSHTVKTYVAWTPKRKEITYLLTVLAKQYQIRFLQQPTASVPVEAEESCIKSHPLRQRSSCREHHKEPHDCSPFCFRRTDELSKTKLTVVLLDASLHQNLLGQHHKDDTFLSVFHQPHYCLLSDSSIFVQSGHFFQDSI